ncbi:MAG TPA: NUDIX hydrolase [Micromonosporaceae bacterium]|nr:NUDIX hydrolase [Micromonosporaceae bacterium]
MTAVQPHEYAVRARHERFRGSMFRVVSDEVAMPGGGYAVRDYLVHIGSVGVVALDEAGRVVLIRQYRHPVGRELWELPAGLVDVAGESLVATAARELAEEADLTAARWNLLLDAHLSPGCSREVIRLFLARDLAPVPAGERHTREHEEARLVVERVDLDEAVRMALGGEITNAACLVGVLAAARARDGGWVQLRPADTPPI